MSKVTGQYGVIRMRNFSNQHCTLKYKVPKKMDMRKTISIYSTINANDQVQLLILCLAFLAGKE